LLTTINNYNILTCSTDSKEKIRIAHKIDVKMLTTFLDMACIFQRSVQAAYFYRRLFLYQHLPVRPLSSRYYMKEDAIVENAEIILYDMLTHLAERMNAAHAIASLSESLSEERAMADWIRTNTPDMVAELWPEIEASIAVDEGE
jgi:Domain of unknown function (DUF892)